MNGWVINITDGGVYWVYLPVYPLFETSQGPVLELLIWSPLIGKWIHLLTSKIDRILPSGHVQISLNELKWVSDNKNYYGPEALVNCSRILGI